MSLLSGTLTRQLAKASPSKAARPIDVNLIKDECIQLVVATRKAGLVLFDENVQALQASHANEYKKV